MDASVRPTSFGGKIAVRSRAGSAALLLRSRCLRAAGSAPMACQQAQLQARSSRSQTQLLAKPQKLRQAQQAAGHQRQARAMPASPARLQPARGAAHSPASPAQEPRSESWPPRLCWAQRPQAPRAAPQLLLRFQHVAEERRRRSPRPCSKLRATTPRCLHGPRREQHPTAARTLGREREAQPRRARSGSVRRIRTCPTAADATLRHSVLRCLRQKRAPLSNAHRAPSCALGAAAARARLWRPLLAGVGESPAAAVSRAAPATSRAQPRAADARSDNSGEDKMHQSAPERRHPRLGARHSARQWCGKRGKERPRWRRRALVAGGPRRKPRTQSGRKAPSARWPRHRPCTGRTTALPRRPKRRREAGAVRPTQAAARPARLLGQQPPARRPAAPAAAESAETCH